MKDYIEALPKEKRPVAGTEGAQYRKKQLMRQLPAHDQEPDQCHDLSPQEKDEMNAFVKKHFEKALGVGNVEEGNKAMVCLTFDSCNKLIEIRAGVLLYSLRLVISFVACS